MSVYSLQKKLAFIHIPKNAGTSIRANLNKALPDLMEFDAIYNKWRETSKERRNQAYANHFPYWRIQELLTDAGVHSQELPFEDMFSFMVVRNPWERMVSLYRHRLRKLDWSHEGEARNTDLDKKIARAGFIPWLLQTPHEGDSILTRQSQLSWGMDSSGGVGVDKIVKIEELERTYPDLIGPLGIKVPPLGFDNVGDGVSREYRAQYNDEARDHVGFYFAADIEAFNYEF